LSSRGAAAARRGALVEHEQRPRVASSRRRLGPGLLARLRRRYSWRVAAPCACSPRPAAAEPTRPYAASSWTCAHRARDPGSILTARQSSPTTPAVAALLGASAGLKARGRCGVGSGRRSSGATARRATEAARDQWACGAFAVAFRTRYFAQHYETLRCFWGSCIYLAGAAL
jgi:hypothetical protein